MSNDPEIDPNDPNQYPGLDSEEYQGDYEGSQPEGTFLQVLFLLFKAMRIKSNLIKEIWETNKKAKKRKRRIWTCP